MNTQREDCCCYVCGRPGGQARVLIDVATAMRLSGVSRSTFFKWLKSKKVESVETPYGRRVCLSELFREPRRHREIIA